MKNITPSGGSRTTAHIDLNVKAFKAGERVLFEGFGGWRIGAIDKILGNTALIGVESCEVTRIRGRVPAGADDRALLASLQVAEAQCGRAAAAARAELEEAQARILREAGVR